MDVFKAEHKKDWYKKINPKLQLPAIKDGDFCMNESIDICKYLIETRKISTPFYPLDDQEKRDRIDVDIQAALELGETYATCLLHCYFGPALGRTKSTRDEKQKYKDEVLKLLDKFEAELVKRGTKYYTFDGKSWIL